ncbi:NPCC multi-domain protein [Pyrenophora tritici-repentis]|nr:NPCC multi-domain protein [Pyrenophora tritici-repentis]
MSVARYTQSTLPQTPGKPSAQPEQPYTPNGSWKHPQFEEIARRQYATTFDERNIRAIILNAGILFLSVWGNAMTEKVKLLEYAATPINALVKAVPYSHWGVLLIRFLFVANIVIAFLPLVRRYYPDDMADIALTPSQRAAMGLKADVNAPPTPGSVYASPNYVTPPRYQRSTPRSNSFSNGSQSPLNGSPRASLGRSTSNSSYSPNSASPMFQRTLSGSAKRSSYGSPMSSSLFGESSSSFTPGTPTPSTGKASVGLNNKWLYEKRRDSPKSSLFM